MYKILNSIQRFPKVQSNRKPNQQTSCKIRSIIFTQFYMTWEKRKVNSKVYLKYVHCGHDFYVMMFLSIIFSASVQLSLNQQGTGRVEQHLINMVLDGVTVLFLLKFHIMCQWGRYKLWVSTSISGLIFTSLPFVVMLQADQFSKNAFQMGKDPVFFVEQTPSDCRSQLLFDRHVPD